ncbi:hypothetical protein TK78_00145 [Streptomyces sp. Tue 6075]|nr:hypothetical protein TK78_00145 [Streptomyces sp. Tue 6075]
MELVADQPPTLEGAVTVCSLGQLDRAVEGDPGHDLGVDDVPAGAADLPDPHVRLRVERLQAGDQAAAP